MVRSRHLGEEECEGRGQGTCSFSTVFHTLASLRPPAARAEAAGALGAHGLGISVD